MHFSPLPGAPAAQRVRTIPLQVDCLPSGGYRLSSPLARGWAAVARTHGELAKAIQQAYVEVTVASYARAKGEAYDLDAMTMQVSGDPLAAMPPRRIRGARSERRQTYDVEDWTRLEDGRWRSPSGRAYREDTALVRNVRAKRDARGLPT